MTQVIISSVGVLRLLSAKLDYGKDVPVLKHHAMKAYGIHDLGTKQNWVVSFTPRPLYPQRKELPVPTEYETEQGWDRNYH
jgi:hypothetical protein